MPLRVIVTGGAGFIGSHAVVELVSRGDEVLIVDNFSRASPLSISRIEQIIRSKLKVARCDVLDTEKLKQIFVEFKPDMVIHFAGLKSVGESSQNPLLYYRDNLQGAVSVLEAMQTSNCHSIVFSSSATVYGEPEQLPITEDHPVAPESPYGRSKLYIEEIIRDWCAATTNSKAFVLRYFNPIGAHKSGLIGEDPTGIPNNLMPFITRVAVGSLEKLQVFGDDYPTSDGTGSRDYIHVTDLAHAHAKAIDAFDKIDGCEVVNVGTGQGYTVLEVVRAFESASGITIPYEFVDRRPGDVAAYYADCTKAKEVLGWTATNTIDDMCRSSWNWQHKNPKGYNS